MEGKKITERIKDKAVAFKMRFLSNNRFLRRGSLVDNLINRGVLDSESERGGFYKEKLVDANPGMGYCMDERKIGTVVKHGEDNQVATTTERKDIQEAMLRPAFPGGALGWVTMFEMMGYETDEAIEKTKQLYEEMGWGKMVIHMDDHHGDIKALLEGGDDVLGCGFLGIRKRVVKIMKKVFGKDIDISTLSDTKKSEVIHKLFKAGAEVVVLTGNHKADEAHLVINHEKGKTLDVGDLYDENPTFRWDAWATANDEVLTAFKELAGDRAKDMDLDLFYRLQLGMNLITAELLGALHKFKRFSQGSNVVFIGNREQSLPTAN